MLPPKRKQKLAEKYSPFMDNAKDMHFEDSHGFHKPGDENATPTKKSIIRIWDRLPTRFDNAKYPNELRTHVRDEIKELLTPKSIFRKLRGMAGFLTTTCVIFVALMLFFNAGAYYKVGEYVVASMLGQSNSGNFAELTDSQSKSPLGDPFMKNNLGMFGTSTTHNGSGSTTIDPSILDYFQVLPESNRILIPKIGQNIPIQEVSTKNLVKEKWQDLEDDIQTKLQDGVVHYPGTAYPGQIGNVFITGHSSYYLWDPGKYKDVFALLHNLEIGDSMTIFYNQERYDYVITEKKVVSPNQVNVLSDTHDRRLTLMTCTPIGTALNRLIIVAKQK